MESRAKKPSEWCSLEALPDDHSIWLAGHVHDPVFDAVSRNETESHEDGVYQGVAVLDWDDFAIAHAAYLEERNAYERHERMLKRNGASPSKGGVPRVLHDRQCAHCGNTFRPKNSRRKLCSPKCARRHVSNGSKYGKMMDRIQAVTGMRRNLIAQRLVRGWTEERCIKQGIQKKTFQVAA